MDHFIYKDGILHAENVALPEIATAVGTPFYVYSTATLTRHYMLFTEALKHQRHLIAFAVKANSNQAVLATLAKLGAGMDVVSGGEYARARAAGVPGERIVFSGVGKSHAEMIAAIEGGVYQINLESAPEAERLSALAVAMGAEVPVAIRVNPDVDAKTHAKISTGKAENKFGIPIEQAHEMAMRVNALSGLRLVGLTTHIGSQLMDLAPYRVAYTKLAELTRALRAEGLELPRLDLGGGLGIPYTHSNETPPLPLDYGAMVDEVLAGLDCAITVEPGRLIVGNAGLLVSKVEYVKHGTERDFLILDAAMNDLLRPALYDAYHEIVPIREAVPGQNISTFDVVGPVCETGDTFARARPLPHLSEGDLVAFRSAGAYSAAMASEYNTRPLIPEVMVSGSEMAVIRERPSFDMMIGRDIIPEWLKG